MTPKLWTTRIAAGALLLLSLPAGAVAANDGGTTSRLTIGGQPLTRFVHIELTAPLVAFDLLRLGLDAQPSSAQPSEGDEEPAASSRRRNVLIGSAVGVGLGLFVGSAGCCNEGNCGCSYTAFGGLIGAAIGFGIGGLFGN